MDSYVDRAYQRSPQFGCALILLAIATMCIWPMLVVDAMQMALSKLHLHPAIGLLVMLGMLLGGFFNFAVHRIERDVEQVVARSVWQGWLGRTPLVRRTRTQTIIAVNLGGCVIPMLLAAFEILVVLSVAPDVMWEVGIVTLANISVCYFTARPIQGVGIVMPVFLPPAVAVGLTWLLLMAPEYHLIRAPVAFIAGVAGPLIGADLLHLRDITRVSVGVLSIGGAGTFDGIVLSGMLAAFIA